MKKYTIYGCLIISIVFFSVSNINAQTTFGDQNLIIQLGEFPATEVYAADIDGDGDQDVLSAFASYYDEGKIVWFENTDGYGTFGTQHVISDTAYGAWSLYATDIDGDGDIDVLSASSGDNSPNGMSFLWYENTDGLGTFVANMVSDSTHGVGSVYAADIDGDGDQDVISAEGLGDILWYENIDGNGTFGSPQEIEFNWYVRSVYATDIDNDGDQDVLSASDVLTGTDLLSWYENMDGNGTFETREISVSGGFNDVISADIDGDEDQDVLSSSYNQVDNISWYENTNGFGIFGAQQLITDITDAAVSIHATDIDCDGDQDVLSASGDDKIAWYENTDGLGTFGAQQVITTNAVGACSVYSIDIDGDEDQDVLSASHDGKIAWYENLTYASVETLFENEISIFPNPAGNDLNISTDDGRKITEVYIYSVSGQRIINLRDISGSIDISGLHAGMYIVEVTVENKKIRQKLLVQR